MCDTEMMHLIVLLLFILRKIQENIEYPLGATPPPSPPHNPTKHKNVIQWDSFLSLFRWRELLIILRGSLSQGVEDENKSIDSVLCLCFSKWTQQNYG